VANRVSKELQKKLAAISESNLSIYSSLDGRPELFLKLKELEEALSNKLVGLSLHGLPIRTRSKVFKTAVCEGLGYLAPLNFRKTRPRFPGQDFDTYVQKANNLQIWNEEISPTRRYVLARCDPTDVITKVRVITGEALAEYDRTGTLTKKYQARRKAGRSGSKLISERDTDTFRRILVPTADLPDSILRSISPTDTPIKGRVLAIRSIYDRLTKLVGDTIESHGSDQERNRGIGLQRLVCPILGLKEYADKGQFPDVLSQALAGCGKSHESLLHCGRAAL